MSLTDLTGKRGLVVGIANANSMRKLLASDAREAAWLGLHPDPGANLGDGPRISAARHTLACLRP
jgi:hypothetical protein